MLDIIVSLPCPFAGLDFSDNEDAIDESRKQGHILVTISYLHGLLEEKMGYDLGLCLNGESIFKDGSIKEGIYDARVRGYENPCRLYIWITNGYSRGLLVDYTSAEDVRFASKRYSEKAFNL